MSTDYSAICRTCRRSVHVGQHMAGRWSFGYGSNDEAGRLHVGAWLEKHVGSSHDVGFVLSDYVPPEFERDETD